MFVAMPKRRKAAEINAAIDLLSSGLTHSEVSRQTGIPIGTLRTWLYGRLPRAAGAGPGSQSCPCCGGSVHDFGAISPTAYAYLLGAYLGDGYIATVAGGGFSLRVSLDHKYPRIVGEVAEAITVVRGRAPWIGTREETCDVVVSYWREWPCWFPQHGPGRKHKRRIELSSWQEALVSAEPGRFVRGLIHTDGWRGLNRVSAKGREYAYPRYQFSNRSDDIRRLFTDACDQLSVAWRPWGRYHVSVARGEAVARLDEIVGPKR
jgi:hypothetical protein